MLAAVIVVVILVAVALLAVKVLPVESAGGQPQAETSTGNDSSGLTGKRQGSCNARKGVLPSGHQYEIVED